MRYSDDGEPGGTAGMPVLNVLRSESIENVCCVVTRYFGGIKLGTGGLARAYSAAAKEALEEAGTSRMALWKKVEMTCSYTSTKKYPACSTNTTRRGRTPRTAPT
jgi:putative IMPACT (imprinted ancient) family translation regulator